MKYALGYVHYSSSMWATIPKPNASYNFFAVSNTLATYHFLSKLFFPVT